MTYRVSSHIRRIGSHTRSYSNVTLVIYIHGELFSNIRRTIIIFFCVNDGFLYENILFKEFRIGNAIGARVGVVLGVRDGRAQMKGARQRRRWGFYYIRIIIIVIQSKKNFCTFPVTFW